MTRCINHFTQKRETANGAEKSENQPASTRCHQPKDKFVRKKEKIITNKQTNFLTFSRQSPYRQLTRQDSQLEDKKR
jgi:hypothetical protein